MPRCVACSSTFHLGRKDAKICPICLQKTLKSVAHCRQCHAPLDLSSPYCQNCKQRHGMANCKLCGYELFKHASIVITRSILSPSPHDTLTTRIFRNFRRSKEKRVDFIHLYCAKAAPHLLKGAMSVEYPRSLEDKISVLGSPIDAKVETLPDSEINSSRTPNSTQNEMASQAQSWDIEPEKDRPLQQESQNTSIKISSELFLINAYQDGERLFQDISLVKSCFSQQDLSSINLRYSNLTQVQWEYLDLTQADLSEVVLDRASFRENNLSDTILQNASFREAQVFLCNFSHANLCGINLTGSDLYASYFQNAQLRSANLSRTKLDATNLSFADLDSASLYRSSLIEAILQGANLRGCHLEESQMKWANLQDANLEKAHLQGASLRHSNLRGANFSQAQLLDTDLSNTNLRDVSSLQHATYNSTTKLPVGFIPRKWNMIFAP